MPVNVLMLGVFVQLLEEIQAAKYRSRTAKATGGNVDVGKAGGADSIKKDGKGKDWWQYVELE